MCCTRAGYGKGSLFSVMSSWHVDRWVTVSSPDHRSIDFSVEQILRDGTFTVESLQSWKVCWRAQYTPISQACSFRWNLANCSRDFVVNITDGFPSSWIKNNIHGMLHISCYMCFLPSFRTLGRQRTVAPISCDHVLTHGWTPWWRLMECRRRSAWSRSDVDDPAVVHVRPGSRRSDHFRITSDYLGGGLPCLSSALWCQYPNEKFQPK